MVGSENNLHSHLGGPGVEPPEKGEAEKPKASQNGVSHFFIDFFIIFRIF